MMDAFYKAVFDLQTLGYSFSAATQKASEWMAEISNKQKQKREQEIKQ